MQYEQPRHRQPRSYPGFSIRPHGALVVRNHNPAVFRSPLENIRIWRSVKVDIPNVEEVCVGDMQLDLRYDLRINILVCK